MKPSNKLVKQGILVESAKKEFQIGDKKMRMAGRLVVNPKLKEKLLNTLDKETTMRAKAVADYKFAELKKQTTLRLDEEVVEFLKKERDHIAASIEFVYVDIEVYPTLILEEITIEDYVAYHHSNEINKSILKSEKILEWLQTKSSIILIELIKEQISNSPKKLQSISSLSAEELSNIIEKTILKNKMDSPPTAPKSLMSRHEVAEHFDVNLSTIHRWTIDGTLTKHGTGGKVHYKRDEVEKASIQLEQKKK